MKQLFLILLLSVGVEVFGQTKITWEDLDCEFKEVWSEEFQGPMQYPLFTQTIEELERLEIEIVGEVTIFDFITDYTLLGKSHIAFGCGSPPGSTSSPVEMIELHLKDGTRIPEDGEICRMKGTLELNSENVLMMIYILEDAEIIE